MDEAENTATRGGPAPRELEQEHDHALDHDHVHVHEQHQHLPHEQAEVEAGWPRWSPDFLRDEQPRPPPTDVRVEEELAAQSVALEAGYEPRRVRKFLQRRTVDYSCTYLLSALERLQQPSVRRDHFLRPTAHAAGGLLAPVYYDSGASSITATLVHTSTNKVRCPVNVVRVCPFFCARSRPPLI